SVAGVISLTGYSLLAAVTVLTIMIAPLMVSIFSDGLRSVKPGWLEGSLALGVNRWRTTWKIGVRAARPAIVAGTVLAVARAIGEAGMLAVISGSGGLAPDPGGRPLFLFQAPPPPAPATLNGNAQPQPPPAQPAPVRDRHRAALLGRGLLAPRPPGAAGDAPLRSGLMGPAPSTAPRQPAPPATAGAPKPAVEGSAAWRLTDRLGLALCWALG